MNTENQKRMDWHLFFTALGVVVALGSLTMGGFVHINSKIYDLSRDLSRDIASVKNEVSLVKGEVEKIQTVLILKGIAPPEIFAAHDKHEKKLP